MPKRYVGLIEVECPADPGKSLADRALSDFRVPAEMGLDLCGYGLLRHTPRLRALQ
jgi:hypothetical protein